MNKLIKIDFGCIKCGCKIFVHVPANPEEFEGYECQNCGRDWYDVRNEIVQKAIVE